MPLPEQSAQIRVDAVNDVGVCSHESEFPESAVGNQSSDNQRRHQRPHTPGLNFELDLPEELHVLDAVCRKNCAGAFPPAALCVPAESRPITAAGLTKSNPTADQECR